MARTMVSQRNKCTIAAGTSRTHCHCPSRWWIHVLWADHSVAHQTTQLSSLSTLPVKWCAFLNLLLSLQITKYLYFRRQSSKVGANAAAWIVDGMQNTGNSRWKYHTCKCHIVTWRSDSHMEAANYCQANFKTSAQFRYRYNHYIWSRWCQPSCQPLCNFLLEHIDLCGQFITWRYVGEVHLNNCHCHGNRYFGRSFRIFCTVSKEMVEVFL